MRFVASFCDKPHKQAREIHHWDVGERNNPSNLLEPICHQPQPDGVFQPAVLTKIYPDSREDLAMMILLSKVVLARTQEIS